MTDEARVETPCDHCGQTDDHPKIHYGVETYHHDCMPMRVVQELEAAAAIEDEDYADLAENSKRALEFRQTAMKGTRGPKLLAHIRKVHGEG